MQLKPLIKAIGNKVIATPDMSRDIAEFKGRYIEPFVGGGTMFFHRSPANAIINDIDENYIRFYRDFAKDPLAFYREVKELAEKHEENIRLSKEDGLMADVRNSDMFFEFREELNNGDYSDYSFAAKFFYVSRSSGGIKYNLKGKINANYSQMDKLKINFNRDHGRLLAQTTIMQGDFEKAFELATKDDFLFIDPPPYKGDKRKRFYPFTEEDHLRLADAFKNTKAKAAILLNENDFLLSLYKSAASVKYTVGSDNSKRVVTLATNYTLFNF